MYHQLQHETIPKLLELNKQPLKLYLALCQYADIERKAMIKIPEAIMVENQELYKALRRLTPIGFKVYMFILYRSFYYQERGGFQDEEKGSHLREILDLNHDQLVDGFIENRRVGWLDALSIARYKQHDQRQKIYVGEITFQWYARLSPLVSIPFPSGSPMENPDKRHDNYAVGLYLVLGGSFVHVENENDNEKYWQAIREVILDRDERRCAECESTKDLHVHHLTYDHEGYEFPEELITLCQSCHAKKKSI